MKQDPNPSIRGVGAPMDGLSALPWTARWCQGTLPCPQSVDKRCRRSHGRVERLAMDGPVVSRYLTLSFNHTIVTRVTSMLDFGVLEALTGEILLSTRRAKITAVSHYLPERRLTNKDFENIVDTSDTWILER